MSGRNSKYFCKKATGRTRPPMTKFGYPDGVLLLARATGQLQRRQPYQRTRRDLLRSPGCTRAPDSGCIASYLGKTDCAARIRRDLRADFREVAQATDVSVTLADAQRFSAFAGWTRAPDSGCIVRYLGKTDCAARTSRDLRVGFRVLARSLGHLLRCPRLRLPLLDVLNVTVCSRAPDSASNVRNLETPIAQCEPVETYVSIFGS